MCRGGLHSAARDKSHSHSIRRTAERLLRLDPHPLRLKEGRHRRQSGRTRQSPPHSPWHNLAGQCRQPCNKVTHVNRGPRRRPAAPPETPGRPDDPIHLCRPGSSRAESWSTWFSRLPSLLHKGHTDSLFETHPLPRLRPAAPRIAHHGQTKARGSVYGQRGGQSQSQHLLSQVVAPAQSCWKTHSFHLVANILWGVGGRSAPDARAALRPSRKAARQKACASALNSTAAIR